MVAFSRKELDPERLPALQQRIRSAQEDALQQIGTVWPRSAQHVEQDFDAINAEHLTFIRSAIKAPQITALETLKKHGNSTNRLLQQGALGGIPLSLGVVILTPKLPFLPWLLGLILLAASYPSFKSALKSSKVLRQEMPWMQVSTANAQFLKEASFASAFIIWCTIVPAILTLAVPFGLYTDGHMVEVALTTIYILGSIFLLLLGTSIGLFVWILTAFMRTNRRLERSEGQSHSLRLDAMENLLKELSDYNFQSRRRNLSLALRTAQTIRAATAQVADELVAEYAISPALAQRLKDASWWESRILYTTPEFTPGAPFPTAEQIAEAERRVQRYGFVY